MKIPAGFDGALPFAAAFVAMVFFCLAMMAKGGF